MCIILEIKLTWNRHLYTKSLLEGRLNQANLQEERRISLKEKRKDYWILTSENYCPATNV